MATPLGAAGAAASALRSPTPPPNSLESAEAGVMKESSENADAMKMPVVSAVAVGTDSGMLTVVAGSSDGGSVCLGDDAGGAAGAGAGAGAGAAPAAMPTAQAIMAPQPVPVGAAQQAQPVQAVPFHSGFAPYSTDPATALQLQLALGQGAGGVALAQGGGANVSGEELETFILLYRCGAGPTEPKPKIKHQNTKKQKQTSPKTKTETERNPPLSMASLHDAPHAELPRFEPPPNTTNCSEQTLRRRRFESG